MLCENPHMQKHLTYAQLVAPGIYCVDTGFVREHFDASYMVLDGDEVAFIDVGTNYSTPRFLNTLDELGLSTQQVKYIVLTHVHLDHAGGAGEMMRVCEQAQLLVHPRGARHMIDPSALRAGAVGVYGEEIVEQSYGQLLPVEAARVVEVGEGHQIHLGSRILHCLDTPGHAKHHIAIWDPISRGVFTGDTFGLSYREFDTEEGEFIMPTTTPIQFDPEALKDSVLRISALKPDCLFPTHFSRINDVERLKHLFLEQLDEIVVLAKQLKTDPNRHALLKDGMAKIHINHLKTMNCKLSPAEITAFLQIDLELNALGIGHWLDKS
jgi:glyoxylase-like metal-dependent hydrolase (beta-lactamase superfamily II)